MQGSYLTSTHWTFLLLELMVTCQTPLNGKPGWNKYFQTNNQNEPPGLGPDMNKIGGCEIGEKG